MALNEALFSKIVSRAIKIFNLEKKIDALKKAQEDELKLLIESDGKDFTLVEVDSLDTDTKTIITKAK